MMKRSLALLLAMVMVLSMLPMNILAEGQSTAEKNTAYTEPLAQHAHAASGDAHICEHCVAAGKTGADAVPEWQPIASDATTFGREAGHYYLTGDMVNMEQTSVDKDVVLCLNGHTIKPKAGKYLFRLYSNAKLTILDCTAKTVTPENDSDTGYRAGKIYGATTTVFLFDSSNRNAQLYWYDGILEDNAGTVMSIQVKTDSTSHAAAVHMYGGQISGNTSTGNGPIYLGHAQTSFEAENVKFVDNSAAGNGGVFTGYNAVVEVTDCLFQGNSAKYGGVFCNANTGAASGLKVTATGCTFTGNSATEAGGVYWGRAGNLNATGCTFTGNSAKDYAAIAGTASGVKVTLDGCTIENNTCTGSTGAVYVANSTTPLTIKGKTVIYNNTGKDGVQANVYLKENGDGNYPVITVADSLGAGTKVGVTLNETRMGQSLAVSPVLGGKLTREQVIAYFYADNTGYMVDLDTTADKLVLAQGHVHTAHLDACSVTGCTGHENNLYLPLTAGMAFPTSGNYYLEGEYTLADNVPLSTGTLNLCLNGQTLKLNGKRFNISGDATLNITDCKAKTEDNVYTAGKITGGTNGVFQMSGDTDSSGKKSYVNIYEGIITENVRTTTHASVAFIEKKATFNLFGGEISGNTVGADGADSGVGRGGTIYLQDSTVTFNMYGGKITGNHGVKNGTYGGYGAAIFSRDPATINILGGEISNNDAAATGGAIYAKNGGKITVKNAKISNNTATGNGGAIYANKCTLTLENAELTGNSASSGGAIYATAGTVTVKNTKITGNTATTYSAICGSGGGIKITLDGAEITGNTATGNSSGYTGGAIYIPNNGALITVQGATKVTGNTGYNVYLQKEGNGNHPMIAVGTGLSDDARISIFMNADRLSAQPYASLALGGKLTKAQAEQIFSCDNTQYEVTLDEQQDRLLVRLAGEGHKHCVCGVDGCTKHDLIRCSPWSSTDSLPTTAGSYYLENNVDMEAGDIKLTTGTITLCLNGKTVDFKSRSRIQISGDAKLNITDCPDATTGEYTGKLTGSSGSVFYMTGDSSGKKSFVNLYQGIISGNNRPSYHASVAYIQSGATFNMYGGEISGNTVGGNTTDDRGGTIFINNASGTFNMYGGVIKNNTATRNSSNKGGNGAAIYNNKGTVNLQGGEISGNIAALNGGAIYTIGGTVTMAGCKLESNTAVTGGAIYAKEGAKVTDNGSTISGNKATSSAAIYAHSGSVTLNGTKITGNEAVTYSAINGAGGGVQITLNGAEITGNKATSDGTTYGAIYIPNSGAKITVQGAAKVENNEGGNVYLTKNSNAKDPDEHPMITIGKGGLADGAKIGITMPSGRMSAQPYASLVLNGALTDAQVAEYFFCDNSRYEITLKDDRLHIAKFYLDVGHKHCLCDDSVGACDHKSINWLAWDDPTALPSSGNYCLTVDVKTSANVSLTGDSVLNLCLNGHTITATGSQEGTWRDRIFDIKENATLNITDCTGKGQLTGGTYGVILFEDNQNSKTTFNLFGGNLTGNKGLNYGGAVLIQGGGTMNMYGGAIHGNNMNGTAVVDAQGNPVIDAETGAQKTTGTSYGGGAIGLNGAKTTFNMYGGKIYNNECMLTTYLDKDGKEATAGGRGGAIYSTRGNVNIYGGEISGNRANQGGAIYAVINSKINIAGGNLTGNTTGHQGAGIFADNSTVTVSGGKITKNVSEKGAGGIQISNGKGVLTVTGGEITDNTGYYGGGIMCQGRASISIEGGLIARNKADTAGGVYIATLSKAKMTGGTITENEAVHNAGGLYILRNVLDMTGGEITNNISEQEGGGLYVYGATLNLDGGVISGNTAKAGGGISMGRLTVTGKLEEHAGINAVVDKNGKLECRATVNVISGSIEGNTSKGAGGGMLVQGYGTLNVKGGEVKNNTSGSSGGGAYLSVNSTVEMTGGTFSGNHADGTGGGMYMVNSTGNFSGGVFEKNTTKKQGAGLCTSHSEVKLSGVKIRNHNHKGVGAGYTGFNSDTTMSGGSITGNYASSYGAGMYLQRGKLTVTGGSVSYNSTKGTGAGIYLAGIKTRIYGGYFAGNKCEGTGGGVLFTARWNYTENGVKKQDVCDVLVAGGTFTENYGRNGGAMLIQSGATLKITGGTFTKNEGPASGGALFVSTDIKFEITGGTFTENKTTTDGGAINFLNPQGTVDGSSGKLIIENNYAKRYGGAINITGEKADVTVKNLKVNNNSVSNRGGGVAVNTKAHANFENVEICDNHSEIQGGGFYMGHGPIVFMKDSKIHDNTSEAAGAAVATECTGEMTMENVLITKNETKTKSGGVYTRAAKMHLINCQVIDNVAGGDGGGVATGKLFTRGGEIGSGGRQDGLIIENCVITGNTCVGAGGGVHLNPGNYCTIINSEISGNTSGLEGSGIWATEHLKIDGATITGNTSQNDGYAFFIADASYDGQSYIQALLEMGGDVIIKDNVGGEMYMGAMNAIATMAEGFGENTEFYITLDSGVLTKRLLGAYDYQKSEDGIYTVTYGTRSMTEPEKDPAISDNNTDVLLYVGVGAFVVLAAAAVVLVLLLKKKKAQTPAAPAAEE